MHRLLRYMAGLLIASAMSALPARACSTIESYRIPTNFELVQEAQLIVLARVASGPKEFSGGPDPFAPEVRLEPIQVLKGTLPSTPLGVAGTVAWNGRSIPTLPSPLSTSHFSVGLGACLRMFYPVNGLVVAMFGPAPEGTPGRSMVQLSEPFARAVEDVEGPDSVWVHAVAEYAALQAKATGPALRQAVEARRAALAADTKSVEARAIADDLRDYLDATAPSGRKASAAARWIYVDMMDDVAALVAAPGSDIREALRCKTGGTGVELYAIGRKGNGALALSVGGRSFTAKATGAQLEPGIKSIAGELPLDEALSTALSTATGPVLITVGGHSAHSAASGDMMQKLVARCAALLRS